MSGAALSARIEEWRNRNRSLYPDLDRGMPRLFSRAEACRRLNISLPTLKREIARGRLREVAIGRAKRIAAEDLDDYVRRLRAEAAGEEVGE